MLIAICDDIKSERESIKNICCNLGETNILTFSSPEQLFTSEKLSSIDLLFLDIELGNSSYNGIDVKNKLEYEFSNIFIVFCTSHDEMMPSAFGKNVLFFLKKPYSTSSIKSCMDRVNILNVDFHIIDVDPSHSLLCKDILYLNSNQKYTIFYNLNNSYYDSRESIVNWIKVLEKYNFCQISRSSIINLKHFVRLDSSSNTIVLRNNITLKISRRFIKLFKEKLQAYQRALL